MFYPYPGIQENILWTIWVYKNLDITLKKLEGSKELTQSFAESIGCIKVMLSGAEAQFKKQKINIEEMAFFDPKSGEDVIPVEIDGKGSVQGRDRRRGRELVRQEDHAGA